MDRDVSESQLLLGLYASGHAVTAAVTAALGYVAVARTEIRARRWLGALMGVLTAWAVISAMSLFVPVRGGQVALRLCWTAAGLASALFWVLFAAAYSGRDVRTNPVVLSFPVGYVALVAGLLTTPWHGLYYTAFRVVETPFPHTTTTPGPLYIAGLLYVLLSIVLATYYLGSLFARSRSRSTVGVVAIAAAVVAGVLPLAATEAGLLPGPVSTYNHTPFGISVFALAVTYAVLRLDLYDLSPLVRTRMVEETRDPFLALDASASLVDYNPAAKTLLDPVDADALGDPLDTLVPDLPDSVTDPEGSFREQITVTTDGQRRHYSVLVSEIVDRSTVEGYTILLRDITDRKQYAREIEQRNQKLAVLNRAIRHDIRNDMNVILGNATTLEDRVTDSDAQALLDSIIQQGEHAVELTETARKLMTTMLEEGRASEPVALEPVLDDELDDLRVRDDATVAVEGDLPTVTVRADDMLGSVFRNLLTNAVRHNDADDPEVTVSVTDEDESVVVRIADNGPGIPDDQKDDIFARGEKGLDSPGSGIGLYLVDTLVDSYGGEVWIEDNDPRGAIFAVRLVKTNGAQDAGHDRNLKL